MQEQKKADEAQIVKEDRGQTRRLIQLGALIKRSVITFFTNAKSLFMKNNFILLPLLGFIFLVTSLGFSQYLFKERFEKIEANLSGVLTELRQLTLTNDSTQLSKEAIVLQNMKLDLQEEQFSLELDKQKQQLFWYNIGFVGVGSLFGFLTLLFWLPKEIERQAKQEVDKQIVDIIRGRSKDIQKILSDYDQEKFFKSTKKICITGGNEKEKVENLLIQHGFHPSNIVLADENLNERKYDILFINNLEGDILPHPPKEEPKEQEENNQAAYDKQKESYEACKSKILGWMTSAPKESCIFYYSEKNIHFPVHEIDDYGLKKRINFATNPSQIYGNLINSLKYQESFS